MKGISNSVSNDNVRKWDSELGCHILLPKALDLEHSRKLCLICLSLSADHKYILLLINLLTHLAQTFPPKDLEGIYKEVLSTDLWNKSNSGTFNMQYFR